MQVLHLPARYWVAARRRCGIAALLAVAGFVLGSVFGDAAIGQQVLTPRQVFEARNRVPSEDQDVVAGVYLPTDRTLSRAVTRAKDRIADHEYHEALPFLQGILTRNEDSFLERSGDDRGQLGLKAAVLKLIGDLPPEGRDAYELLQGPAARRQLEAALKSGDRDGVAKVVRQFFHTIAGYDATFVLAQMEADQGHRLAAAQLYQELIDTPRAAARFEPQLSVAAALNQLAAGQKEAAATTIRALADQKPGIEVTLQGKTKSLASASADPLAWLAGLVGEVNVASPADSNWLTIRGDASRNVECPGGEPHLRPRWEARVVNEPAIESFLTGRANDFLQRSVVAIPGARPIAVGDVVVMRTPGNVVAVDWQTGKRVWETRDEQELDTEDAPADLAPGLDHDQLATQSRPIEERMWDDALATALSSDGSRVFVVRGVQSAREDDSTPWQVNAVFARGGTLENAAASNQLAAYDLASQGKLAWELDGSRTAGPLAGAFFLGPPLAIDNTLYVMAEIRGALYVLAIDPTSGHVDWQQQLVGLEQGIAVDPARRRVGATPSYSSGILVCPTAASTAIGIDVVKREFAWVYRYPREPQTAAEARNLWQQQQAQGQLVRANDQWLDNTAVIADNRVLLTPPESGEIHCLDLHSGKLLWKRRQGDALYIGGVDKGTVLLVGSQAVQSLHLSDGAPAWKLESVSLPSGTLPAGQGYMSQGKYYLPLTSGQIAEIDMATGTIANDEPANPHLALGNLICYRGSVLSQSPLLLDKFEQLDLLQKRTESALAKNPDDPAALRELAEIKSTSGDKAESIRLLKSALKLSPDDTVTQEMLAEALLQGLASDYAAYRADVALLSRLIHTREQQIELLRIDAAGQDTPSTRLTAWDAYLKLADFTAEEPAFLRIDDHYTVRSDRWIASQLAALWAGATSDERKQFAEKMAARRPALKDPHTTAELRHYIAHLGGLPGAGDVQLALAKFLVDHGRSQEAEIELLKMIGSPDQATQTAAAELMAKLSEKTAPKNAAASINWPRGHVDAELIATSAAEAAPNRGRPARPTIERQNGFRQLRVEQDAFPDFSDTQWFVAMDGSEIVGRNALGDDVLHWGVDQSTIRNQYRDIGLIHGAQLGHLLFFTLGGQVMALDSRQDSSSADGDLLWPNHSADEFSTDSARLRRGPAGSVNRTSRPPVYHTWSGRKRIAGAAGSMSGALGPVSPQGVVYQDQDDLKCVDPLTGTTLWARSDIPVGCELFGDNEYAFAADIANHVAYVIRISNGELLGKRELPKGEWLITSGRNIAQIIFNPNRSGDTNRNSPTMSVTVTDIWSQKTIYQADFPTTARISVVEPKAFAVFEPSGAFQMVDVETGRKILDQKLEPMSDLQSIQTMQFDDDLYLFASGQTQGQFKPIGQQFDFPLINGSVYAFSLKSGEPLWPAPAVVRNRGLVLQQPRDIPLLVFTDRQMIRDATNGGGSQLRVLCIDRRTGQTVYRNDALPDTSVTRFRIRGETDSRPTVALEMSAGKIQLAMTDRPRPPQPPANDDLEAPREIVERGLKAVGQRLTNSLRAALERPTPGVPQQIQPQQIQQQPPKPAPVQNPRPAQSKAPDTDDD